MVFINLLYTYQVKIYANINEIARSKVTGPKSIQVNEKACNDNEPDTTLLNTKTVRAFFIYCTYAHTDTFVTSRLDEMKVTMISFDDQNTTQLEI